LPKRTSKPAAVAATPKKQQPSSACRVALIGFGTVGRAVAKILCETGDGSLQLTYICNRNVEKKKRTWLANAAPNNIPNDVLWTDDVQSVLNSDVDIVIELIGGLNPAEQIVRGALESGKSVVTANKQLIARHGSDLLQLASRHGCQLEFGASVAGGVPVLPALRTGLCGDRLHGIAGILNGTCNYILSRIENARIPFSEALEEAQARGYAEADASEIWMAATLAPNSRFSRWPGCTPRSRRNRFAPAPFAPSTPLTSTTPRNSDAPSARFREPS